VELVHHLLMVGLRGGLGCELLGARRGTGWGSDGWCLGCLSYDLSCEQDGKHKQAIGQDFPKRNRFGNRHGLLLGISTTLKLKTDEAYLFSCVLTNELESGWCPNLVLGLIFVLVFGILVRYGKCPLNIPSPGESRSSFRHILVKVDDDSATDWKDGLTLAVVDGILNHVICGREAAVSMISNVKTFLSPAAIENFGMRLPRTGVLGNSLENHSAVTSKGRTSALVPPTFTSVNSK
jgi:hypothetical protein